MTKGRALHRISAGKPAAPMINKVSKTGTRVSLWECFCLSSYKRC